MDTRSAIQEAISRLSTSERYQLSLWMYELRDREMQERREREMQEVRVAEIALDYREPPGLMTVEEYLAFELQSSVKHEYVAGQLFAMSGASRAHNRIILRLLVSLETHLRGGPYEMYTSEVKVHLKSNMADHFYYPDMMVVCDRSRLENPDSHFVRTPTLIVEVLSPSTESIDRREKWLYYRQIETLEEYVLVDQEECEVTIFRREHDWRPLVRNSLEEVAEFQSIGLSLPLERIYRDAPLASDVAGDPEG
jgi:Uma2 family endonuclease